MPKAALQECLDEGLPSAFQPSVFPRSDLQHGSRRGDGGLVPRKVTHAEDPEAECPDDLLAPLHEIKSFAGYPCAVRDPGTEAGLCGGFSRWQSHPAGEGSDIGLGKAGLFQRCKDREFPGGLGARPQVCWVVGILTVG